MKKYIAFDFDGTLCKHLYPSIGEPIQENIKLLKLHKERGDIIIIWTCRGLKKDLDTMIVWLKKNKIPYDYINENPDYSFGSPKVVADIYYDDRSGTLPVKYEPSGLFNIEDIFKDTI